MDTVLEHPADLEIRLWSKEYNMENHLINKPPRPTELIYRAMSEGAETASDLAKYLKGKR